MTSQPSWRLKLERADVHREEVGRLLAPFGVPHEYIVTEHAEPNGGRLYRVHTPLTVNPLVAVVFGDFLFNVRSALDHLAVALAPVKYKYDVSFPIFLINPADDSAGGSEVRKARTVAWDRATRGMSAGAVAVLMLHQPFNADPPSELVQYDLKPRDHVLGLLSSFQNADKHRQLVTTVAGLVPAEVVAVNSATCEQFVITGPDPFPANRLATDGAVVYAGKTEMSVRGAGIAVVGVGTSKNQRGPYRRILDFMSELLRVAQVICDDVEALN